MYIYICIYLYIYIYINNFNNKSNKLIDIKKSNNDFILPVLTHVVIYVKHLHTYISSYHLKIFSNQLDCYIFFVRAMQPCYIWSQIRHIEIA